MKTHRALNQKMACRWVAAESAVCVIIIVLLIAFVVMLTGCCKQQTHVTFPDQTTVDCNSTTFFKDMTVRYRPDPNDPKRMIVDVSGGSSSVFDAVLAGVALVVSGII